jgi:hypothetical protein
MCGPLSGYSDVAQAYAVPYGGAVLPAQFGGNQIYDNIPSDVGRTYYVYYSIKI